MLDSRRVLAPAPKLLGQNTSLIQMLLASHFDTLYTQCVFDRPLSSVTRPAMLIPRVTSAIPPNVLPRTLAGARSHVGGLRSNAKLRTNPIKVMNTTGFESTLKAMDPARRSVDGGLSLFVPRKPVNQMGTNKRRNEGTKERSECLTLTHSPKDSRKEMKNNCSFRYLKIKNIMDRRTTYQIKSSPKRRTML